MYNNSRVITNSPSRRQDTSHAVLSIFHNNKYNIIMFAANICIDNVRTRYISLREYKTAIIEFCGKNSDLN